MPATGRIIHGFPSRQPARGVSLLEVLVSMFILLFGLVGVASLFPVGKYHAQQAIQYDQAAAIGQRAFEEIRVRGLLQPQNWSFGGNQFTNIGNWQERPVMFDPIGVSVPSGSPWVPYNESANGLRRVTWRDPASGNSMTLPTAESIFRSHDDLALEIPGSRTSPAIQRISSVEREYTGNYSWAFTAVPAREMGEGFYHVSVVVFRGRNVLDEWYCGGETSNKLLAGFGGGQGQLRLIGTKDQIGRLKMGEWILLSVPGDVYHRWFKIVSLSPSINDGRTIRIDVQGSAWKYSRIGNPPDPMRASIFGSAVAVYEKIMRVESDLDWQAQ